MSIRELARRNRSYRRFDEAEAIAPETLRELVDLTRFCACGKNMQSLRYITVTDEEKRAALFPKLAWAGYLAKWKGPAEGERPAGYVIVLQDQDLDKDYLCDDGIAIQTIMLGATEKGLGGCIMGAINRDKIRELFAIPDNLKILYVLALGKPAETVVIDELDESGDIKYWRDDEDVHHVPKRALSEYLVGENPGCAPDCVIKK